MADLARCEEFAKLRREELVCFSGRKGERLPYFGGDVECSVWDVQVPNDEDESRCHGVKLLGIGGLDQLGIDNGNTALDGYLKACS